MSQPGPFGPFPDATPKPIAPLSVAIPPAGSAQMEYLRSFQYIFDNPNWLMNLIWSFVCNQIAGAAIPILPAMVFMGYQFEMLEDLHANRGTRYPDFDINRLVDYLGRGVWPVLVLLIAAFVGVGAILTAVVAAVVCSGVLGSAGGEDLAGLFVMFGVLLGSIIGLALLCGLSIYVTPMMLRAGLAQDLGAAFDFAWINDFVRKMWIETVLSSLFMFISVFGLLIVTCFLAALVIGPIMPFVSTHLFYQLYSIYLSRGGTPIPLKPRLPVVQPGYVPPPQY